MIFDKEFPSIHARHYLYKGKKHSLYEIGHFLSRKQLERICDSLRSKGIPIESLTFVEYAPNDTMRHLFIKFTDKKEVIPYFQLDKTIWLTIVEEIKISQIEL